MALTKERQKDYDNGCALKNELVTPDVALDWLGDAGVFPFLAPEIGPEAA